MNPRYLLWLAVVYAAVIVGSTLTRTTLPRLPGGVSTSFTCAARPPKGRRPRCR